MKSTVGIATIAFMILALNGPALGQESGWREEGSVVHLRQTTDKVGIGTDDPAEELHVAGYSARIINQVSTNSGGGGITLRRSLGSVLSPTSIGSGTGLTNISWAGYNGTGWIDVAHINVKARGSWAGGEASEMFISTFGGGNWRNELYLFQGNVGIGTTSPQNKLDVKGSAVIGASYSGTNTAPSNGLLVQGNVGIGTTNPASKLHINSGALIIQSSVGTGSDATLVFTKDSGDDQWRIAINEDQNNKLYFFDDVNDEFRMVIQQDGNVGIGTTSPAGRLHIEGGELIIQSSAGTGSDATLKFRDSDYGTDRWRIAIDESQSNKLYFFDDVNDEYRMVIQQDGNVGIGTTNPGSYKLAVNGKIRAKEVVVETGWSDFVFKADYDLMPLPKVERYIAEHQHLPDMPSAEEVAADGLSLGETQALLLQKIEELTLYMIDLKKENEALETRMGALEIN